VERLKTDVVMMV